MPDNVKTTRLLPAKPHSFPSLQRCGTIEDVHTADDTRWIAEQAEKLGFDLCGVVRTEKFPELQQFEEWLGRDYGGEMKYLADERRREPALVMDNLQSAIVCALNYNTAYPYSIDAAAAPAASGPRGWISRYAWGSDYHEVLWEKLNALQAALHEKFTEPFAARSYADTGPVAERIFAKYAGLGWLGKNTLLLNETLGSWSFLGVILTSLDLRPTLAPAESPPPDLCGQCRQCLDACPTGALVEPYVMDARKCISYLTIELRGEIPEPLREPMGWQVYGCDICQDVCPYNRQAPTTQIPKFQPRRTTNNESLFQPELLWLASLNEQEFRDNFRGSAMKRAKWKGLVRNACNALGNAKVKKGTPEHQEIATLLSRLAQSPESSIAVSAQWALSRIE
jgi:epoxyqueuosine reductase